MTDVIDKKQPHPLFKLATELGPLIVFFVANAKFNLFVATGAFMVAIVAAMIASYVVVRHVPRHHIGRDHRSYDRHHEGAGGDEQMVFRVGDKEHDQRTEFGRELEQRMRLGLVHLISCVAVITREGG